MKKTVFTYNELYTFKDVKDLCKANGLTVDDAYHFWRKAKTFGEGKAEFTTGKLLLRAIIRPTGNGVWEARKLTGRTPFGEWNPHRWTAEQTHWRTQSRRCRIKEGRA